MFMYNSRWNLLERKVGSKGSLWWLDSLISFIKNNTCSSKLVLREDPTRESLTHSLS